MKRTRPPEAAIRKVTVAASAITCGADPRHRRHWAAGTEDSVRPRSQVMATVLESAEPDLMRPAIGQWTTPEGEGHFGVIPAPPGHPAEAGHPVWIDETGHITYAPKHQVRSDRPGRPTRWPVPQARAARLRIFWRWRLPRVFLRFTS
jgi:hypothetical protein